ncbi:hypothetical protein ACN4EG_18075 [Alkalinema pantanalense CENA528]|uniref:hypothetical protein n=1 Tax=Alkalinema pantanalense TaxID=1620705 RepID=UPI003D6F7FF3
MAGYKALRLLITIDSSFIPTLPTEIWRKWIAIIITFPAIKENTDQDFRQQLIQKAYQNSPDDFIRTLIILIEQQDNRYGSIHILPEVEFCWDERLAEALFQKVQDKKLQARSMGDLLKELLVHRVDQAILFAKSLISLPPPTDGGTREKAIVAAQMLMLYSEDAGWSVVWSAIQQDSKFGREVLEAVSYAVKYEGNIEQRLKEEYIADLYIFLAKEYPDLEEQNKNSDEDCDLVTPRDSIKIWKDYIPQRLQELGTQESCNALRKIIYELPHLKDKLQWRLLEAEALVRRKTWIPPTPEEFLKSVLPQQTSNSELLESIKQMADQPKIDQSINFGDNNNINGVVNTGNLQAEDIQINHENDLPSRQNVPTTSKKYDWKFWLSISLTALGIIASVTASGVFNDEIKKWLFKPNVPPHNEHPIEKNAN